MWWRASALKNSHRLNTTGVNALLRQIQEVFLFYSSASHLMHTAVVISMFKTLNHQMFYFLISFQAYIVDLFKNLIDQQSWNDDGSISERLLRSSLLLFACVRKYQPCVVKAEEYFRKWKDSNGTLRLVQNDSW